MVTLDDHEAAGLINTYERGSPTIDAMEAQLTARGWERGGSDRGYRLLSPEEIAAMRRCRHCGEVYENPCGCLDKYAPPYGPSGLNRTHESVNTEM